jgi:two-component system cell cycle sensor histidine kinase/response regulator CckA
VSPTLSDAGGQGHRLESIREDYEAARHRLLTAGGDVEFEHIRLLLVEDDPGDVRLVRKWLRDVEGVEVSVVDCLASALECLECGSTDVVLLNPGLPDSKGMDTVSTLIGAAPSVPVIVLTGNAADETGLAAIRAGADDYLVKDRIRPEVLVRTVQLAVERRRVERALLLKESIIDSSSSAIASCDLEGNMTYGNPSFLETWGFDDPAEFLGEPFWELWLLEDSRDEIMQVLRSGATWSGEAKAKRKDGALIDVQVSAALVRDHLGNPLALTSTSVDITEKKRAEEALRNEISRRRILVDQSTDGIVVLDQDGKVYEANESYARMLGYSMEEIYQLHVWDWESQYSKEQTLAMLGTVDEKGDHIETRHRRKDGTLYDVEISTNGAVVGGRKLVFCVCRDVTERKLAEEALRESRERLAFALDSAGLGSWDWNPQTDAVVYSDLWAQLLEYGLDETEPTVDFFKRHVHPDDLPAVLDRLADHLEGRRPEYEFTYRLRTKSGRWIWVHDKGRVVLRDEGGRPTRAAGVVLDITESKRDEQHRIDLERQVQQSQKLESLGVLAGGIAHDFNNILTSVLGNAELALAGLSASAPARENLSEIVASSRRAAELCQQMLAFSGRGSFIIEPMDLGELINGTRALLESVVSKKALLVFRLEKDLPLLECDSSQILQVIMNLVMNASEAIGEAEGTITISTAARECSGEYLKEHCRREKLAPGRYLTLEVSDTGCGMDAETQDRIFDPFFTTKHAGRGLGLAGVGGIVRGHQGAVEVRSEPGTGTTFVLLLPAMPGDAALPPETGVAKGDWQGSGTILFVDDEEAIRTLGMHMLSSLGFAVRTAADGREALEVYREHQGEIALVIMDLTMPRLDGWETFQELRLFDPQVRVLLSSGYAASDADTRFGGQGLAGFLHKPYSLAEFEKQLRSSLEGGETVA